MAAATRRDGEVRESETDIAQAWATHALPQGRGAHDASPARARAHPRGRAADGCASACARAQRSLASGARPRAARGSAAPTQGAHGSPALRDRMARTTTPREAHTEGQSGRGSGWGGVGDGAGDLSRACATHPQRHRLAVIPDIVRPRRRVRHGRRRCECVCVCAGVGERKRALRRAERGSGRGSHPPRGAALALWRRARVRVRSRQTRGEPYA